MTHKDTSQPQEQALTDSINLSLNANNQRRAENTHIKFYYAVGLITLISALIFVIFYLPKTISKPELETSSKVFMEKELSKPIDESPWHEAQLSKHRKTSQEILAKVLEKQKNLEAHHVILWGQKQFELAFNKAKNGDLFYRNQEFDKAISLYSESLTSLTNIELDIPRQYGLYLKLGIDALNKNDALEAIKQLKVAMYLQPNETEAQEKYDRALVLDEVLSLNKEGQVFMKNKSLDIAKERFITALSLDQHAILTKENLAIVDNKITQRDFSKAMSRGYISLNKNEFDSAIKFFSQAQKISPELQDPKTAIIQSKNQKTQSQISKILNTASLLEKELKWHLASKQYNKALKIDASLTTARIGLIRSRSKAELENKLNYIIKNPMRLSNSNVLLEAQNTYKDAIKIQNPDEKLIGQISTVKNILKQSKLPINMEISSDDLTSISIFRVGDIGRFISKNMQLKPGEYTLIGSRNGYRDVRKVVTLIPGSKNNKIQVMCVEKVNNG